MGDVSDLLDVPGAFRWFCEPFTVRSSLSNDDFPRFSLLRLPLSMCVPYERPPEKRQRSLVYLLRGGIEACKGG